MIQICLTRTKNNLIFTLTKGFSLNYFVFNLAYISVLFMYFRLTPLNAETQPLVILALTPIMLFASLRSGTKLSQSEKFLILFWLVLLIYGLLSFLVFKQDISKVFLYSLRLLVMPLAYLLFLKNSHYLGPKSVKFVLFVLFAVAIIEFLRVPVLNNLLENIYNSFFDRYIFGEGSRGLCILTTEPSYFVYFAILLMFSIDYLNGLNKLSNRQSILYRLMVILMGLMTKSAFVYLFIIIYIGQRLIRFFAKKKKISVLICLVLIVLPLVFYLMMNISIPQTNNRFLQALSSIVQSVKTNGLIDTLFFADASGGFRLLINAIYILSIFMWPFGTGYGGLTERWLSVANSFHIDVTQNGHFLYTTGLDATLDAQAYIPNLIGTIGVFVVFFLLFLYTGNFQRNRWLRYSILFVVSLFFWFLQSNFFNPVFWIVIGIAKNNKILIRR